MSDLFNDTSMPVRFLNVIREGKMAEGGEQALAS